MSKLRRRMPLAFLLMLVVLLINAYVTRSNTRSLETDAQQDARSRQILLELTETLSTIKDAETGQRGFLLTGNAEYLEPYAAAVAAIQGHLANLSNVTSGNSVRRDQVQELAQLTALKLAELNKTIQLYQAQGREAAVGLVRG